MGRIGVSEYQVFQAADQLEAEGVHPSVDSVRVELGNTGSRTTINKYLKEWRARRVHREQAGANLGGHLLQVLSEQSGIILSALEAASEAKFQVKSQQYESTLHTQNEQLEQLRAEMNRYRAQVQELELSRDKQSAELQQTQSELTDSRDDNLSLRESLAKEVGRRESFEGAIAICDRQMTALQKDLKSLQARNEILAESHAGKAAELQQLQLLERERRAQLKEKAEEIKHLNQALKTSQRLREKEIARLTLTVNQLVWSRSTSNTTQKKATPKR